jgi:hypothetical protein
MQLTRHSLIPLSVAAALLAVGCAAPGDFPSLTVRPAELNRSTEEPVRKAVLIASDPQLLARIADLLTQTQEGQRSFEAGLSAARSAVKRAGAAQSESWIEAQQAVSRLESARAPTVTALFDLDQLAIARAAVPTSAGDFTALIAAIDEASAVARRQREELERLQTALRPV